jgi:hypothetical protein
VAKPIALMPRRLPETDYKDLSKINTNVMQSRNSAAIGERPVYGLDTETTRDGDIFLLMDSDGRRLDKDIAANSVFEFLFHKKYQNSLNVFFNLSFDARVILKLLGSGLNRYRSTRQLVFEHGPYRIKYIPNKVLTVSKGHHSTSFYDISQFYEGDIIEAYEKNNLGRVPQWYKDFKKRTKEGAFTLRFYRDQPTATREYCKMDCVMAKALGEKFLSLYRQAAGFYPMRLLSSGYLVEKAMVFRGLPIPQFSNVDYRIQDLGYRGYVGGRFEMLKRGFIGDGSLYDINSAYPDKIAQLPDFGSGQWVEGTQIEPKASVGFCKIAADIPDDKYLAPFPFRANHNVVFPSGQFITYCTIAELRVCERKDYYQILQSWQFIPNDRHYHPFEGLINEYFAKKRELKDKKDPLHLPFKTMLNSIYGKTGETIFTGKGRIMGRFFHPVIFAQITGATRAQLYRYVIENGLEKYIVFMATDSICTTRYLGKGSPNLGQFALQARANDIFCIQNGINRFNGNFKNRGIGKMKGRTIENPEIFERDGKVYMPLRVERVTNLKSAIYQNRIAEIGKFNVVTREIDLNADGKRLWLGRLISLEEDQFNDSMPLSLNFIDKDEL